MRRLRIELLSFMVKRWRDDESRILMARALFESKDFKDSLKILKKVKNKNTCDYLLLLGELSLFFPSERVDLKELQKNCSSQKVKVAALTIYYLSEIGNIESAFNNFRAQQEDLIKNYGRELVVKAALNRLLERAILTDNYPVVYQIARALYEGGYKDCFVGSYYLISAVRLGKEDEAKELYGEISACVDSLAGLAKSVYRNYQLERELGDGVSGRAKTD